jgi:uncharacterized membrane protein
MATVPPSGARASWVNGKTLVFVCIALMMAYVLQHNERFLIDPSDPNWKHIESFRWWLLPHGLAGACALLLAPLQFSDWLRQRYTRVHRVVGRIYLTGVFVLAPLGVYIQYFEERLGVARSFTIATAVDAMLLISTASIALYFILNRKIQQHRQWMTRSYAVALVFFEVRLISGILGLDDSETASETIVWICLAFSIPLADLVLQIQESRRARTPAAAQLS